VATDIGDVRRLHVLQGTGKTFSYSCHSFQSSLRNEVEKCVLEFSMAHKPLIFIECILLKFTDDTKDTDYMSGPTCSNFKSRCACGWAGGDIFMSLVSRSRVEEEKENGGKQYKKERKSKKER